MRDKRICGPTSRYKTVCRRALYALALAVPALTLGCGSSYGKHATAVAVATAPVVDQAAAAYSGANGIHAMRTDYDAIAAFDAPAPAPVYNPRTVPPLLSADAIKARLAVLAAFQAYVQSVVAITSGTDSPQLQAASKSAGQGIMNVTNTLAPAVESTFGIAAQTVPTETTTVTTTNGVTTSSTVNSATAANPISTTVGNGISTGIEALGQFLINRRLKKDLPPIVISMDPVVQTLCELLENDVKNLKVIEGIDYNYAINQQTLFLRQPASKMDPGVRRMLITKLPAMVRQQQASMAQLDQLSAAVKNLERTHHAFAADVQNNNPESLKQKLAELEAAGESLGKFYSSL